MLNAKAASAEVAFALFFVSGTKQERICFSCEARGSSRGDVRESTLSSERGSATKEFAKILFLVS